MGIRRQAREIALQILFQLDLNDMSPEQAIASYSKAFAEHAEMQDFVSRLIHGVVFNRAEIDENLQKYSLHWKLSRMTVVDRNILRMAVFEILYCDDIPSKVSLDEAIELGKIYGTEESQAFINGILDPVAREKTP